MTAKKFTGLVVNPFSDKFQDNWDTWKQYKEQDHKFVYRSNMSEQAGLNELVDLSDGDEQEAVRIINRSMAHGWKGLFRIHKPKNQKKDGDATDKQPGNGSGAKTISIEKGKAAHAKRYGNGE